MKIYIDADACPVQEAAINIAKEKNIPIVLVKSFAHFSHDEQFDHVETIYVDNGKDMADFRIVQLVESKDLVITHDYGLASLCLNKGCFVLHPKGFAYTSKNIDRLLHTRHQHAMARRAKQRTPNPKKYTARDEQKFSQKLQQTLQQNK